MLKSLLKYRTSKSPALEYLDRKNILKQPQSNPLQPELANPSSVVLKIEKIKKDYKKSV